MQTKQEYRYFVVRVEVDVEIMSDGEKFLADHEYARLDRIENTLNEQAGYGNAKKIPMYDTDLVRAVQATHFKD